MTAIAGLMALFTTDWRNRCQQVFFRIMAGQFAAYGVFDFGNHESVVFASKADTGACGTSAAGAANTVDIIVGLFGEREIHNVTDAVNMNTATSDIGGN